MIRSRLSAIVMGACILSGSGLSTAAEGISERELMRSPQQAVGRHLRLDGMACVDPGGLAGFRCIKKIGGQMLVLDVAVLGDETSVDVANTLMSDCKGTANAGSPACRMSVTITPTSVDTEMFDSGFGSMQRVILYGRSMDMRRGRIRR